MARKTFGGAVPPGKTVYHTKPKSKKPQPKSSGGGSIFDALKSLQRSTAENVERQAVAQKTAAIKKAPPSAAPINPIDRMMQDFQSQYQSIDVAPTPLEELRRMAESQVGSQFDPMIQMLTSQMEQKKGRAKGSQKEAREMYGALSRDFLSQIPQMTQQFAAEDREANQRYDAAQQQLQKMYGQQSQQQQALLQQLGIQAAAPDASQRQMEDQAYFQNQLETEQQGALNALQQQQNAAQTYQQQLGSTTRVAGENAAQDIGRMLEDYLSQADIQKSGLQQQRGTALQSLLSQMQTQDAQRVRQEEQQQFENLMALSRFQLDSAQAQAAAQRAAGSPQDMLFKGTTGLSGAQNFLGQQYSDQPILATGLMEQIQDVLANPEVVKGKFVLDPGDEATGRRPVYSDVGQEMMMDLLRKEFEKENSTSPGRYQTADINNAINALLAYMGKLR